MLNEHTAFHSVKGANPFLGIEVTNSATVHFSVSVRAGHFFDPEKMQGLAHLLEHLLFLGSETHPGPNEIIETIQQHGGNVNAWTSGEYANYHFSCPHQYIDTIIPAFIGAIFSPLFLPNMIKKEINAIDAEFQFKLKDELRRLYQIHKETCNPAHPFSKFSVGNAELFSRWDIDTLKTQLSAFHQRYYSKTNIRVALSAPTFSEHTISLLTNALEALPEGEPVKPNWPALYREQDLKTLITIKPLQEARRLIITFAFQTDIKPLENALFYLSHILGDESEGSLLAYLRMKGWATNLVAGSGIEGSRFKDFNLNIQLTALGETTLSGILNALFYTLLLVKRDDASWRRDEKAQLDYLAREFSESPPSIDTVCDYAERLFEDVDFLSKQRCSGPELLAALGWMTVNNIRMKLISPSAKTTKACKYYEAEYHCASLDDNLSKRCQHPEPVASIHLPQRNPFLSTSPTLKPREPLWKALDVLGEKGKQVWFRQDHTFNTVKGDLYSSFDLQNLCMDSHSSAVKRIWLHAINTHLQESLYQAEIAGLHFRTYGHQCGFTLHCRGFTHVLLPLAKQVLHTCLNHSISLSEFEQARQAQKRALANSLLNKPINRLLTRLGVIIQRYTYAPAKLIESLESAHYESFQHGLSQGFNPAFSESLLNGNWSMEDANTWSNTISALDQQWSDTPIARHVVALGAGKMWVNEVQCEHDDAAVVFYLQAPKATPTYTAYCMLLDQLIAGPYFNALRTEQQLGYVVGTGYAPHNQHPGIVFYVQSPTYSANELFLAMMSFLKEQINNLALYKSFWPNIRNNLLKQVSDPDTNLAMQSQRMWLDLASGNPTQSPKQQLIKAIESFSFEQLVSISKSVIQRENFGEMLLYAPGKYSSISNELGKPINDLDAFKANAQYVSNK